MILNAKLQFYQMLNFIFKNRVFKSQSQTDSLVSIWFSDFKTFGLKNKDFEMQLMKTQLSVW
jgi:hypothetical protein